MRILVINQYFPPDATNSAYILGELAEELGELHEVRVVAGRPSYDVDASAFRPRGIDVVRVWSTTFSRVNLLGRAVNYATFLLASAAQALRGPRTQLVVAMTDPPFAGVIGALAALRHRCSLVILLHDLYPDIAVALGVLSEGWVVAAWRRMNAFVWKSADTIVVVGRDMAAKLERDGVPARKLRYIPTWSADFPTSPSALAEARRQMGWEGRFVIMHAGNQGLAQNVTIFARLAQRLRKHPEMLVVILGNGAGREALEAKANRAGLDNLAFMDARPKDQAQILMGAADLHVISLAPGLWGCAVPSKTYGIMAAGRPFIAAVDPGAEPDLIQREFSCGATVLPDDDVGLAEAVLRLRAEPLDELGGRAYAGFTERFRRETVTATTRRLLEEVVADRG